MARRLKVVTALLALIPFAAGAGPADDGRWYAGPYSFSDELGGFRILSIRGAGTRTDPIEIGEELYSVDPITLVIRAAKPLDRRTHARGALHLRIATLNRSRVAWIEFEFELQEIPGKASDFYDGLSFDQVNPDPSLIISDRFGGFKNNFESFDRLRFTDGHTDPRDQATFGFVVTDVTPVSEFYLLQDPRIPDS